MDDKKELRQNKWEREQRERIIVIVSKGTKARIRKHNRSMNEYINKLIENDLLNKEDNTIE